MKNFMEPSIEVITFAVEDVITDSTGGGIGDMEGRFCLS